MGDHHLTGWRYAYAVQTGTAHLALGTACQDHVAVQLLQRQDQQIFLAAVADGAGSASEAQLGAAVVCTTLLACALRHLAEAGGVLTVDRAMAQTWMRSVVERIEEQAQLRGCPGRELAATALLVIACIDGAACIQVGDGLIVVATRGAEDGYQVALAPQRGEYANTTVFACDQEGIDSVQVRIMPGPIRDVALMSDGLQDLVLNHATRKVHAPFFDALLPIVATSPSASSAELNGALGAFLASAGVSERSDDDKTLVLATLR